LRAIQKFIAQDSEVYAERMVARIIERIERTALFPPRVILFTSILRSL
jgi:hypothetical protein